jgi:hypothetical protein
MRAATVALLGLVITCAHNGRCTAQEVFIRSGTELGHGLLHRYHDRCYVIVPKHVITTAPGPITVIGKRGVQSDAAILTTDSSDFGALLIPTMGSSICDGSTDSIPKQLIENILKTVVAANLRSVDEDGSETRVVVSITRVTARSIYFAVPEGANVRKGMSGSVLSAKGSVIGMLTGEITSRKGVAYRADYIESFWNLVKPPENGCSEGCDVDVSELSLVKNYVTREESSSVGVHIVYNHYDSVYQLPGDWPVPPFLHVWRDKQDVKTDLTDMPGQMSYVAFSFSSDFAERSQDLYANAMAFEISGQVSTSEIIKGVVWSITFTGGPEPNRIHIRIKRAKPLY